MKLSSYFLFLFLFFAFWSCKEEEKPKPDVPLAAFTWSPANPLRGETVTFQNQSENAERYRWLIEGQTYTEAEPQHSFQSAGSQEVLLIAEGPGGTDSLRQSLTVQMPPTELRVFVQNAEGLPQARARVKLFSSMADWEKEENEAVPSALSNENGEVLFSNIAPGNYFVDVRYGDFQTNWEGEIETQVAEGETQELTQTVNENIIGIMADADERLWKITRVVIVAENREIPIQECNEDNYEGYYKGKTQAAFRMEAGTPCASWDVRIEGTWELRDGRVHFNSPSIAERVYYFDPIVLGSRKISVKITASGDPEDALLYEMERID